MCTDLDTESGLLSLFHIPVKDSGDFYSLGDITANGQSLDGNFINILAAVRSVGNCSQCPYLETFKLFLLLLLFFKFESYFMTCNLCPKDWRAKVLYYFRWAKRAEARDETV